jgi:hypothetical protein
VIGRKRSSIGGLVVDIKYTCSVCGQGSPVSVMEFNDKQIHGVTKCLNEQCPEYMEFKGVTIPLGTTATKKEAAKVCILCGVPLGRRSGEWKMYCKPCSFKAKKEKLVLDIIRELEQGLDYIEDNRHEVHAKLLALARIL